MTVNNRLKVGGLLLAAGGSSRLGRPKQLVVFDGQTLLRRAAETLAESQCDPVAVVLGAEFEKSAAEVADLNVTVCLNRDWQTGMSSSIKTGLNALLYVAPELDAVTITLCDQPNVTTCDINAIINKFGVSRAQIVAAEYDNVLGVPALFSRELFIDLLVLTGDKGARELIRNSSDSVASLSLTAASTDIDNLEDLEAL